MRSIAMLFGAALLFTACTKGESAGIEEAKKKAEADQKAKEAAGQPAKVIRPPVPGEAKIPCTQLVDPEAYRTALTEKEPMTVKDRKAARDITSSCSLHRGGKRPNEAEQAAILKKDGILGVLPGDEFCHVTASCSTIEDLERFRKKCLSKKENKADESMGTFACVKYEMVGPHDVPVFEFFDEDTKCILKVGAGPSNTNGESIRKCAVVARDTIGLPQIAVSPGGTPTPKPPAPAAKGSGG